MGVTKEQATKNKEEILKAAERLFRTRGVDAVGLAELMAEAGFTQGGFYNHFASKDALIVEVMERALIAGAEQLDMAIANSQSHGVDPLDRQLKWYLSEERRDDVACGCPLLAFAGDVSHLKGKTSESYSHLLTHTLEVFHTLILERNPALSSSAARQQSIAIFSMMAGAVWLSRAVTSGDPALANEILQQTRAYALAAIKPSSSLRKKVGKSTNTRSPNTF